MHTAEALVADRGHSRWLSCLLQVVKAFGMCVLTLVIILFLSSVVFS